MSLPDSKGTLADGSNDPHASSGSLTPGDHSRKDDSDNPSCSTPQTTTIFSNTSGDELDGLLTSLRSDAFPGYEIREEVSQGGQGIVYQAIQKSTKRKVAIKVLREGPYASKSVRKRFEREIELVAQLKHPNIISIFDSGVTTDGRTFYVMDYVRGLPLNRYVREKKMPLEEVVKLFATLCDAIQYAHQRGIIHRDLKPSNMLVDSEGNLKVLDFGLAKWVAAPVETAVSMTHDIVGTLQYMSPEQARGSPDEVDTRTDIYSLGVILFELLTGRPPYPVDGQVVDALRQISDTNPVPPSRVWKADAGITASVHKRIKAGECPIDNEVETIVLRALSKERERRYQSAGEFAQDLRHYLAGEPIDAKRDSTWYVLRKHMRRYRVYVAVAAITLVLSIGCTLLFASLWEKTRIEKVAVEEQARAVEIEKDAAQEQARAVEMELDHFSKAFGRFIERLSDAGMAFDAKTGRFVQANDAAVKMYGYTLKELLNEQSVFSISAEPEKTRDAFEKAKQGMMLDKIPRIARHKNGDTFYTEINADKLDPNGNIVTGIVKKITKEEYDTLMEALLARKKSTASQPTP